MNESAFELKTHFSWGVEPVEAPDTTTFVPESASMDKEVCTKSLCCVPPLVYVAVNPLLGESGFDCPAGSNVMVVAGEPEGVKSVVSGLPKPVTVSYPVLAEEPGPFDPVKMSRK